MRRPGRFSIVDALAPESVALLVKAAEGVAERRAHEQVLLALDLLAPPEQPRSRFDPAIKAMVGLGSSMGLFAGAFADIATQMDKIALAFVEIGAAIPSAAEIASSPLPASEYIRLHLDALIRQRGDHAR